VAVFFRDCAKFQNVKEHTFFNIFSGIARKYYSFENGYHTQNKKMLNFARIERIV
jgi:hypothetical protein